MNNELEIRRLDALIPGGQQLGSVTIQFEDRKRDFYFYETNGEYYLEIYEVVRDTVHLPREMIFLMPEELRKIAEVVQKFPPLRDWPNAGPQPRSTTSNGIS